MSSSPPLVITNAPALFTWGFSGSTPATNRRPAPHGPRPRPGSGDYGGGAARKGGEKKNLASQPDESDVHQNRTVDDGTVFFLSGGPDRPLSSSSMLSFKFNLTDSIQTAPRDSEFASDFFDFCSFGFVLCAGFASVVVT